MTGSQLFGPLEIEGFTFERVLGSGGFADVFLYAQHMPKRRVAVKIMRAVVAQSSARAQFESEANLMAQLSSHPSIVTIHQAAVAENGRPYLVMEYCSKTNLAQRYQQRVLTVPEMLQTIVRLCGAVETAHLAGILHRDIKPANVLTTDYGWPALTDFGISVIAGEATIGAGGVSIPWAPPEAIGGPGRVDKRSDVYSLAATAYTVLAGHSPFDGAGASTDMSQFMQRILTEPVPPIGRSDVPYELERLLALAMSKNPDERPQTASSLARNLQRIEQDMRLPITHMDIPGGLLEELEGAEPQSAIGDDLDESTRVASSSDRALATAVRPEPSPEPGLAPSPEPSPEPELDDHTVVVPRQAEPQRPDVPELPSEQAHPDEQARPSESAQPDEPDDETRLREAFDLDDRTTVSTRALDESDDHTRVSSRGTDDIDDPTRLKHDGIDRTSVRSAPARGIAIPTTATDVPGGSRRVAYVPGEDAASRVQRYTTRTAAPANPIIRRPPTVSDFPSPLPQTESVARAEVASRTKRGVGVILAVVGVAVVLVAAATVAIFVIVGGAL